LSFHRQRLFVLAEIDEERLKRETAPLKRTVADLERPQEVLDVERAVSYLRNVGSLWEESPRNLQRQFAREVFSRVVVEGPQVASVTPKAMYAPLFVLDRRERFGGEMGVVWLPGQETEQQYYTLAVNPNTGEPLAVPALVIPSGTESVGVV
jgi:hypothetical protein